jgi:hypothetical protein
MSEALKNIYREAGKLQYYFDQKVPCDLYRGQSSAERKNGAPIVYPNPGFTRRDGTVREPDVKVVDRDGKKFVLGCRCIRGDYRGVSTFDRINPNLGGFTWYELPKDTDIPDALAITQDSDFKDRANHYTVAPKDDMELGLFQVYLNALAAKMVKAAT